MEMRQAGRRITPGFARIYVALLMLDHNSLEQKTVPLSLLLTISRHSVLRVCHRMTHEVCYRLCGVFQVSIPIDLPVMQDRMRARIWSNTHADAEFFPPGCLGVSIREVHLRFFTVLGG